MADRRDVGKAKLFASRQAHLRYRALTQVLQSLRSVNRVHGEYRVSQDTVLSGTSTDKSDESLKTIIDIYAALDRVTAMLVRDNEVVALTPLSDQDTTIRRVVDDPFTTKKPPAAAPVGRLKRLVISTNLDNDQMPPKKSEGITAPFPPLDVSLERLTITPKIVEELNGKRGPAGLLLLLLSKDSETRDTWMPAFNFSAHCGNVFHLLGRTRSSSASHREAAALLLQDYLSVVCFDRFWKRCEYGFKNRNFGEHLLRSVELLEAKCSDMDELPVDLDDKHCIIPSGSHALVLEGVYLRASQWVGDGVDVHLIPNAQGGDGRKKFLWEKSVLYQKKGPFYKTSSRREFHRVLASVLAAIDKYSADARKILNEMKAALKAGEEATEAGAKAQKLSRLLRRLQLALLLLNSLRLKFPDVLRAHLRWIAQIFPSDTQHCFSKEQGYYHSSSAIKTTNPEGEYAGDFLAGAKGQHLPTGKKGKTPSSQQASPGSSRGTSSSGRGGSGSVRGGSGSVRGGIPSSGRGGIPSSGRGGLDSGRGGPGSGRGGTPSSGRGGTPSSGRGGIPSSVRGGLDSGRGGPGSGRGGTPSSGRGGPGSGRGALAATSAGRGTGDLGYQTPAQRPQSESILQTPEQVADLFKQLGVEEFEHQNPDDNYSSELHGVDFTSRRSWDEAVFAWFGILCRHSDAGAATLDFQTALPMVAGTEDVRLLTASNSYQDVECVNPREVITSILNPTTKQPYTDDKIATIADKVNRQLFGRPKRWPPSPQYKGTLHAETLIMSLCHLAQIPRADVVDRVTPSSRGKNGLELPPAQVVEQFKNLSSILPVSKRCCPSCHCMVESTEHVCSMVLLYPGHHTDNSSTTLPPWLPLKVFNRLYEAATREVQARFDTWLEQNEPARSGESGASGPGHEMTAESTVDKMYETMLKMWDKLSLGEAVSGSDRLPPAQAQSSGQAQGNKRHASQTTPHQSHPSPEKKSK
ncbi:hypothetical protein C8034_v008157 [Colletotrichum sidae]|uniref:Uncharacterized protein n=1 Tax=Colletotrichum sidae TaxID=1347389 RepID=A0A4R8TQF7_9PEZI|nr:hypothetical protein C8034_v008157 [Colletotrichum sidae]